MNLSQLLLWIIVGGVAGLVADALVGGVKLGLIGAAVVGMLGAVIGAWLLDLAGVSLMGGFADDVITAFFGAVVLLLVTRAVRR